MGHLAVDLDLNNSDINAALVRKREQLKLIEEAVQIARKEKNQLEASLDEASDQFSRRFFGQG
jgi:hypothetical protein